MLRRPIYRFTSITCVVFLTRATWGEPTLIATKNGSPNAYAPLPDSPTIENQLRSLAAGAVLSPAMVMTQNAHGAVVSSARYLAPEKTPKALPASIPSPVKAAPRASALSSTRSGAVATPQTTEIRQCDSGAPQITAPGTYVLTADLDTDTLCLNIIGVEGVTLLCNGHTLGSASYGAALNVVQSDNFAMEGCRTQSQSAAAVFINQSDNIRLMDNRFGSGVQIYESRNGQVVGNRIEGSYFQTQCSGMTVSDNRIFAGGRDTYALRSAQGSNNVISHNRIDGGWNGDPATYDTPGAGADDAIVIAYENGDTLAHNRISNCYDAGIETLGVVEDLRIMGNRITNTGVTGIGGWYNSSWDRVVLKNNQVTQSPYFFLAAYFPNPGFGPIPSEVKFANVSIIGNTLASPRSPILPLAFPTSMSIILPTEVAVSGGGTARPIIENNVIARNHFDTGIPGPVLVPPEGFTIGLGNVWGPVPGAAPPSAILREMLGARAPNR